MKLWRNVFIIAFAILLALWFGSQINRSREIQRDMEIAKTLIDKERYYIEECNKQIENPDYKPRVGSSTIYNFHNGELTVKEQDIKYRLEADFMTVQCLVEGYEKLPWYRKLVNKEHKEIYEKYLIYKREFHDLIEQL